jgi:3-deoxy-manno-octulosonate cytidylyltransferase (CMP-KDO synthetase)
MSNVVIIPSRLGARRLPNKPLAMIGTKPMILHVLDRALEADIGDVVVACGDFEIYDVVQAYGGTAVLTDPNLPTGTDRVYQALTKIPNKKYDYVINLQGDLPHINPQLLKTLHELNTSSDADITTLVSKILSKEELENPNVAKAVLSLNGTERAKAIYFSRNVVPANSDVYYHHIGVYGFKAKSLEKFVNLAPTILQQMENLEQLRALEHGMTIEAQIVNETPYGVDTEEDLERAIKVLG